MNDIITYVSIIVISSGLTDLSGWIYEQITGGDNLHIIDIVPVVFSETAVPHTRVNTYSELIARLYLHKLTCYVETVCCAIVTVLQIQK